MQSEGQFNGCYINYNTLVSKLKKPYQFGMPEQAAVLTLQSVGTPHSSHDS